MKPYVALFIPLLLSGCVTLGPIYTAPYPQTIPGATMTPAEQVSDKTPSSSEWGHSPNFFEKDLRLDKAATERMGFKAEGKNRYTGTFTGVNGMLGFGAVVLNERDRAETIELSLTTFEMGKAASTLQQKGYVPVFIQDSDGTFFNLPQISYNEGQAEANRIAAPFLKNTEFYNPLFILFAKQADFEELRSTDDMRSFSVKPVYILNRDRNSTLLLTTLHTYNRK